MPRQNSWQSLYGAKRRAIDKAILAEAERAIAAAPVLPETSPAEAIARAFGRPIQSRPNPSPWRRR
jgi:hypothetical protein